MKIKGLTARTAQRFAGASSDVGLIGASGWLAICLILLAIYGVLLVFPASHRILMEEDSWVESFTALAYLLAGALLFAAAWAETQRFPRLVFLAGGIAMAFIAGEEIDWGQRILDFPTPDFLSRNLQGECNVHKLSGLAVNVLEAVFRLFIMLPCLATAAALFSRKQGLFGISLPSLPLLLALLSVPNEWQEWWIRDSNADPFGGPLTIVRIAHWFNVLLLWQAMVLATLVAWALLSKRPLQALAAAAALFLFWSLSQVRPRIITPHLVELHELLLGLFWLCYAGELLRATRLVRFRWVAAAGQGESFPLWPAISWLALAGGAGLLALAHFNVRTEGPLEAALGDVRSAEPDIRANFDLHLTDGWLTYFKELCSRADITREKFFLRIFPKDAADLPEHRKRYGFDDLDFAFFKRGTRIRGSCVAIAYLPDYPIASIDTGQYLAGWHDEQGQRWSARLRLAD